MTTTTDTPSPRPKARGYLALWLLKLAKWRRRIFTAPAGEDHLYSADRFVAVTLSPKAGKALAAV